MQSNRSRDTAPELALRRALYGRGLRYRVCARPLQDLRRTVDIVFRSARVAVEVRGCFWHGCNEHYRPPSVNEAYWAAKVARNMSRDRDTEERLAAAGWLLVVVWEHDDVEFMAETIAHLVLSRKEAARS